MWLTSPAGTISQLLSKRPKDIDVAGFHAWPFMSVHYWGELANGTWKLTVKSGNAVGKLYVIFFSKKRALSSYFRMHLVWLTNLAKAYVNVSV